MWATNRRGDITDVAHGFYADRSQIADELRGQMDIAGGRSCKSDVDIICLSVCFFGLNLRVNENI